MGRWGWFRRALVHARRAVGGSRLTARIGRGVEFTPGPTLDELLELCTGEAHREVLLLLSRGHFDVSGLSRVVSMDMGQISRYLHRLEAAGLTHCESEGKHRYYVLTDRVKVHSADGRATLELLGTGFKVAITIGQHDLDRLARAVVDAQLSAVVLPRRSVLTASPENGVSHDVRNGQLTRRA